MKTQFPNLPVLVVDDEEQVLLSSKMALCSEGVNNVLTCSDSRNVMEIMKSREIGLVLLDMAMPHVSGEELQAQMAESCPEVPVIVVTGFNEVDRAVACMRRGAFDYLVKPVEPPRLASCVRKAVELSQLRHENACLTERFMSSSVVNPDAFKHIVTNNQSMLGIFRYIEAIGSSPESVLITGETGTGKELIAQSVHSVSGCSGELVSVNIAGLDDHMFADTLFGHREGAFTGANEARSGMIEKAANGVLFLDEIGDLSPASQVKLLRVIQEREYTPLGEDSPKPADVRIVAATNCDLREGIAEGRFRNDLYYRLLSHHIKVPPLRERPDDIALLTDHFFEKAAAALGKDVPHVPVELRSLLASYVFPGNVRELEGMVSDAVSRHVTGVLSLKSFKEHITGFSADFRSDSVEGIKEPAVVFPRPLPTIDQAARLLIEEALNLSGGNQSVAAGMLGITPSALSQRLKSYREDPV